MKTYDHNKAIEMVECKLFKLRDYAGKDFIPSRHTTLGSDLLNYEYIYKILTKI